MEDGRRVTKTIAGMSIYVTRRRGVLFGIEQAHTLFNRGAEGIEGGRV
jgi:hypothetical protein